MTTRRPRLRPATGSAVLLCGLTVCSSPLPAQERDAPLSIAELKQLSVEELMAVQVTSVSRTEERLGSTAAAITVVTSEDIRRSGATTVPDALRLVPGLHVARQTSSTWAIGSRGFSSVSSEKILVLSDTRSIYTPLFSGVLWDAQDYLLQDVERIEVIRGPGATLWGSNAVNGVINITTKSARDTQGLYLETSAGTEEQASVAARYGGRLTERAYFRVFGKYFDRGPTLGTNPVSPDDWRAGHAGLRADWDANDRDTLTLQGKVYRSHIGQLDPSVSISGRDGPEGRLRVRASGGSVLGRWQRALSQTSELQFRVYYDRTHRHDPAFVDDLDTVDVDFQHRLSPASRHEVTWGSSYRFTHNRNEGRILFGVEPASSRDHLVSGFVQDQVRIAPTLRLTVGTKLEHNDFSGAEVQPSGRVAWDVSSDHTVWSAVSRAVRVPSRLERDIAIDVTDPAADPGVRLLGNPDFTSERLVAFEAGYRWQPVETVSTDVAAFHNRYSGLASLEFGDPFFDTTGQRTVVPVWNENLTSGRTRGIEALVTYAPSPSSRLAASYAHLDIRLDAEGLDLNRGAWFDGSTPRHQFGMRASLDLPAGVQVDALFRHVGSLRRLPPSQTGDGVPGYGELDVRLAWLAWRAAEISVIGQNLLHDRHPEFGPPESRGEIPRGVYGKIAWGF